MIWLSFSKVPSDSLIDTCSMMALESIKLHGSSEEIDEYNLVKKDYFRAKERYIHASKKERTDIANDWIKYCKARYLLNTVPTDTSEKEKMVIIIEEIKYRFKGRLLAK